MSPRQKHEMAKFAIISLAESRELSVLLLHGGERNNTLGKFDIPLWMSVVTMALTIVKET